MSDRHSSVNEALQDAKDKFKSNPSAFDEAQVHLAFGDHSKASDLLSTLLDGGLSTSQEVQTQLKTVLDTIKAVEIQLQVLENQLLPLVSALSSNACGVCPPPGGGTGYWVYNFRYKRWDCIACIPVG